MASITSISPTSFDDGKPVTLTGSGFGASQGQVLIGGVAQNVNTWSDTSITFSTVRGSQSLGACRVDVVAGNSDTFGMSGNLKYVSPTGSDSVSYADNSISQPWQTLIHAIYNLKAGDTLLIRGGTYTPAYQIRVRSTYDSQTYGGHPTEAMNAETGTANAPVIIRNYPGETVTINCANTVDNKFMDIDNKNYWVLHGLTFINVGTVVDLAQNQSATNCTVQYCNVTMSIGGDNLGALRVVTANADGAIFKNNKITGPGQAVHQNTGCIAIFRVETCTVENNELHDAPVGVYFKHSNAGIASNISIKNNYLYNCGRYSLHINCRNADVSNNLVGANCGGVTFAEANGVPGGDNITFIHNTIASGIVELGYNTQSGDAQPGSLNNTLRNNVITANVEIHRYSSVAHNTTMNYNLYGGVIWNNSTSRTLAQWQSFYGQDASSIADLPTFVGGATPAGISGYALAGGSAGKNAASDGFDIGCDIAVVGAA